MAQQLLNFLNYNAMNRKTTKDVSHYHEFGMKIITVLLATATAFFIFYNFFNLLG